MSRIRDIGFEKSWEKKKIVSSRIHSIRIFNQVMGITTFVILAYQSVISLNVIPFAIWLVFGVVLLIFDLFRGNNLTIKSETVYVLFLLVGSIMSIYLANINSMFFIENFNRVDIIFFQIFTGICISFRFLSTLYFESFESFEYDVLKPKNIHTKKQLRLYQDNLVKTDFEFKEPSSIKLVYIFTSIGKTLLPPFIVMLVFAIIGVLYAFFIYTLIPEGTFQEFIVRPAFILLSLLYAILLVRLHKVFPEIFSEDDDTL